MNLGLPPFIHIAKNTNGEHYQHCLMVKRSGNTGNALRTPTSVTALFEKKHIQRCVMPLDKWTLK